MKALTNILTQLLMLLLLMLVACTEDAAEVDNLVRGEEYVTVRMQVPGMKNATTRADEAEDNLTSVWALVFRDGKLVSKTEVTTAASTLIPSTSTTGTFNLSRPKVNDVIHFLGNVPNGVTLPDVDAAESALCNLETGDRENLSYWGKATYTGGDITVNLYRHLAKIEIAPDPNECTFPEDQLFIAGLVNANTKGKLVPYDDENEAFNFDLSDENYGGNYDYCTVPAEPNPLEETPLLDNNGAGFKNWLYVFEHENPETADGLYVICKIGKCYYKVALKSDGDGVKPYNIIRNHKYTILVNDLDEIVYDIPDDITEEDDIENYKYQQALASDPINLEVKEMKDVTLTITPSATSLNYDDNETSAEQVTVTVGGLQDVVETLTFTAPGYTILSDYAESAGEGVFTITDTSKTEIDFTFTLTDQSQAGEISVTGEGDFVSSINTAETSIQWNKRQEVNGEIVMWEGSVKMHVPDGDSKHAAKIPIPYSFFFDAEGNATVLAGSKVHVDYSGTGWFVAYTTKGEWQHIWNIMDDGADLVLTEELLTTLKENRNTVWNVDAAFLLQGGGPTMTKVTLIPAKESITADITNGETLYYDSDDPQVVTVNVTVPDGVERLNISAPDFIFDVENDGEYTYAVNSQTSATLSFTLKSGLSAKTSTITFSDANGGASPAAVSINLVKTPEVTFTQSADMINLNGYLDVTMNLTGTFNGNVSLTIRAPGFTVAAQNNVSLSNSGDVWTYNGSLTTLRFIPTSVGEKTINIDGSGENVKVLENSFDVTVNADITAEAKPSTIYYDGDNKDVTVSVTIPKGVSGLSISAPNFEYGEETGGSYTYTRNDGATTQTTVELTFTLNDGVKTDSSITFSDASGNPCVSSKTVSVSVTNKPAAGAEIVLWGNGEGEGNWGNWNNSNYDIATKVSKISDYYVEGNKIKVYFTTGNGNAKFAFRTGHYNLIGTEYTYTESMETSCTLELTDTTLKKIKDEDGIVQIVATNVTITQISIIPKQTP